MDNLNLLLLYFPYQELIFGSQHFSFTLTVAISDEKHGCEEPLTIKKKHDSFIDIFHFLV